MMLKNPESALSVRKSAQSVRGPQQRQPLLLLFSAALVFAGCSHDDEQSSAYSGPLYPGAGLSFEFDEASLQLAAEYGDIYADAGRAWYNAPLVNTTDTYSIGRAGNGETLAAGEISVSLLPVAALEGIAVDGDGSVSGRYGDVSFTAGGSDGDQGHAQFRSSGSVLTVALDGESASLTWGEVTIDGYGELNKAERAALRAMSTDPMARAITMVALDLGCRNEAQQLDAGAFAALLFPWQMILKYEIADRGRAIPHFLAESSCRFTGFAEDGTEEPLNLAVFWDNSHPIPTTLYAFPFDGDGQRESRP